jgi:alkylation response protein AidB-like acyl-CoA dehydrogenase
MAIFDPGALIEAVRTFIEREIRPNSMQLEASDEYPTRIVDQMKNLGFFSLNIPEEFGGLGVPVSLYSEIMEELSFGWSSLPSFINSHNTISSILAKFGTEDQKSRYLPKLATGELRGSVSMTESNAGSDLQAIRSSAILEPDGMYKLKGNKIFVTNGGRASLYVVLVKTDPHATPAKNGMSLFIIEKNTKGFRTGEVYHKMGFKHVDTVELIFNDVMLHQSQLLGGEPGKGMSQLLDVIETGRIVIAAAAVGTARAALEAAIRFSKERETFGVPISNHQAIQGHLAVMATKVTAARLLVKEAARFKETGQRADMIAGMAKMFASEVCAEVSLTCVRVHGGYGYISDFPAERFYREAAYYVVVEGTNEIQKMIIARRLLAGDGSAIGLT